MRVHLVAAATAMAMSATASPVQAQDNGHRVIAARDHAGAERLLLAERRAHPDRPELMLNLAAVYLKTGRADRARALYADVLAQPDVAMDMLSGRTHSSHAVARAVLASLDRGTRVAAR